MNRRRKIIILAVFVLLLMLAVGQISTIAQEQEPPGGAWPTHPPESGESNPPPEESEPDILAPDDPAALVSSSFTYQGQLRYNGAPVNDHCDFIWDVFTDASGGTSLATDTATNVLLSNGLFTVVIDVPTTVFDGNKRYVEIQVSCPTGSGVYTTLSPRQELYAVPYSLGLRLPFSHTINNSSLPIFAITNTGGIDVSPSILGSSSGGDGVRGKSTGAGSADNGVYGETNSTSSTDAAVKGLSTSSAAGGYFTSSGSYGVYGTTNLATGFGGYFNNSAVTTSGAALYANGDAKQSLTGDGFVKAGIYLRCQDTGSMIDRYFNNVNITPITVTNGASAGRCTVDFGFDVSNRYVVAMAFGAGTARFVTFGLGSNANRFDFFRFDADGVGSNGPIMVLIY